MSLYHLPIDAAPLILPNAWIDNGRREIEVWIPVMANVIINVNDNNGDEDEDDDDWSWSCVTVCRGQRSSNVTVLHQKYSILFCHLSILAPKDFYFKLPCQHNIISSTKHQLAATTMTSTSNTSNGGSKLIFAHLGSGAVWATVVALSCHHHLRDPHHR